MTHTHTLTGKAYIVSTRLIASVIIYRLAIHLVAIIIYPTCSLVSKKVNTQEERFEYF